MTTRAADFPEDPAVIHAKTHGDRIGSLKYTTVIDRTYERGGVEPEGAVECAECHDIAEARLAGWFGALLDGTGPFAGGPR